MAQTTDGWTISTVEQHGPHAGEEMGRVWLKSPHATGASRWQWYAFEDVHTASQAAAQAQGMTQEAFETWHQENA